MAVHEILDRHGSDRTCTGAHNLPPGRLTGPGLPTAFDRDLLAGLLADLGCRSHDHDLAHPTGAACLLVEYLHASSPVLDQIHWSLAGDL